MSHLITPLRSRIEELSLSISALQTELGAYERILRLEEAKEGKPAPMRSAAPVAAPQTNKISFSGNKTTLVADIVKSLHSTGASPKDVDQVFSDHKIKRSKNLIYNTLSYLVSQKRLERRDGRYFPSAGGAAPAAPSNGAAAEPVKPRLSAAGRKRIREALKKRWAAKRAADRAAAKAS